MRFSNRLRTAFTLVCALALATPLQAHTKKGDKLMKLGQKAEDEKNYDTALKYYDQALETDPQDPAYIMADQRMRGKAVEAHLSEGRRLQQQQRLDEALVQFQKAFLADPGSQVALQEIRQTTAMIKERAKVPTGTPILTPAEQAREDMERRINSLEGPPTLRPITGQITSIKINNQPARVLFESIGKLAGINVLFDPAGIDTVGNKNFNLDLNNVTLEEALNYVALETHSFWKPISRNAIFVTQESDQKRQEYQDEVVKVFYIQNASTPNEFSEIYNGIRTAAKLTAGVMSVPSQNAIVARGSVDTVALVEKLVHDLDRPKPEVLIDVIVMEVNKTRTTKIGAALLGQGGLTAPLNFTPRTSIATGTTSSSTSTTGTGSSNGTGTSSSTSSSSSTGTGTSTTTTGTGTSTTSSAAFIPLNAVQHLSTADYSVSLPSTIVNALMSDNSTRVLQRPQLRATDGGKASLKIGEKIPYVSGSLNSAVATPGAIPYATTQFQQVDVGTNIDLEPHVNGPDEISMHIKVEISNVLQQISIAGIDEPEIGQQVDDANIRMKDGEVSILGGLSDKEYSQTLSGFPGLTNIPLLGYLFGEKDKTKTDNEILIALIPHILRAPDLTAMGAEPILAGTERFSRVERRPAATPVSSTSPLPVQPSTIPVTPPTPLTPAANPHPQMPPAAVPSAVPPQTVPPSANRPPDAAPPPVSGSSPGQPNP